MKRIIFLLLLIGCVMAVRADLLSDILSDAYKPAVLSDVAQDSILNGLPSDRYYLAEENRQRLFRHSGVADYYLVDRLRGTRTRISDGPIRDAVLSPSGKYVVYGKSDGNLYIYKVDFHTEVAITTDGRPYSNGIADWLYEEEFDHTCLFAFSPDSKQVAFVRLDESDVPLFAWQSMLPSLPLTLTGEAASYPRLDSIPYPRAGEANPKPEVFLYDIYYKSVRPITLPEREDCYIPRLVWSRDVLTTPVKGQSAPMPAYVLNILRLNRDQNRLEVFRTNPKSLVSSLFYQESADDCFVDYQLFDSWQWLTNGDVLILSDKDGFRRVYAYSPDGTERAILTPEARDVMAVYGYDESTSTLYYQAAPVSEPMTRQVYAVDTRKHVTRTLTEGDGIHVARFSADQKRFIDCFENIDTPNRYTLRTVGKAGGRVVFDNDSLASAWHSLGLNPKQFFTILNDRRDTLYAWMIKPPHFDPAKRYPVVMMQYSGPDSQRVLNRWRKRFEEYIAQQGYVVVCVDGRGTGARGRAWRKATYMQLGRVEADDQMAMAQYLSAQPWVDAAHMAIMGWSYGGYETLMCMSLQPAANPLWQCGIAIAPVTDWRLYDSAYTERFLRRPQVNDRGYDSSSAINLAPHLVGNLLLVHGLTDDNVHAQQSWLYVDALVAASKQFTMQFYPDDNHFLKARANYIHLHRRVMDFLDQNSKQ